MTVDRWTLAVRQQLGLGRLLPLGGTADGAWITERAASRVLRDAASRVPGVRLESLRLDTSDTGAAPAVPAPPSALAPAPLRLDADFTATADEPLPAAAERLRTALTTAADRRIGLLLTTADLRVTALVDELPADPDAADTAAEPAAEGIPEDENGDDDVARVAAAVLAVPGVAELTGVLGGRGRAIHLTEHSDGDTSTTLPRRHLRLELATTPDHRALDVALAVRRTAPAALPDNPTTAVIITAVKSSPPGT
ncbi:nucleopolyhedrovirus P10 family protein [Streptomyces triticagri]|uniref:Nucleopolyhedrovirus P10 family protein n=1 Tax=Streptomyces triticagri TaxID=2293568 RepID=A0A372MDT3_9ACTN|nr:nucleopolyhedrovirus P10 family protein [Streptomyces triticagri]RFU88457.1 nucleopolyhedrovirus P10 family protein [Streptomyces triticagri]